MPKGNHNGFKVALPEGWVSLSEAAKALGIPRLSLWDAVRRGEVTAYREFVYRDRIVYGFRKKDLGI